MHLAEPLDFSRFKLVLKGAVAANSPALRGISLIGQDNALVPIDLVPTLPGRPKDDKAWDAAYAEMVATPASAAGLTPKQMRFALSSKESSDQKQLTIRQFAFR
ncbi:hypothetical protein [Bradyrhizobium jicamae]|uniref:hypothetical protein n=1 Tax=Bradyrhizobium jicamae TaxID=280332 RepID=UPI000AFE86A1|nr:hypothetical protein [Bradyrhizobium jicamae]